MTEPQQQSGHDSPLSLIYVLVCALICCGVCFLNNHNLENNFLTLNEPELEENPQNLKSERKFLQTVIHNNQMTALGAFLLLIGLGHFLDSEAKKKRSRLAEALKKLKTLKDGDDKITLIGEDAELQAAFDNLAASLAELDSGHRQWVADTSHELRTPIAVLRAQVEAFQDGIQEISPRNLAVLHSEIMALSKLVDDMHWLAKYDVGQIKATFTPVDINQTLQDVLESFEERREAKEIRLENLVPP